MLVKVVILVLVKVGDAEDEGPVVGEDDEEVDEEAHNVLLPAETIDRKESVELWKSRNETDVIVADHDVFGTDENDEDSLDSLLRFCSPESLFPCSHRIIFSGWSLGKASGREAADSHSATAL